MKIKYRVIETSDRDEFERQVEIFLSQGWQAQGGVSISTFEGTQSYAIYAQAVTKTSD